MMPAVISGARLPSVFIPAPFFILAELYARGYIRVGIGVDVSRLVFARLSGSVPGRRRVDVFQHRVNIGSTQGIFSAAAIFRRRGCQTREKG